MLKHWVEYITNSVIYCLPKNAVKKKIELETNLNVWELTSLKRNTSKVWSSPALGFTLTTPKGKELDLDVTTTCIQTYSTMDRKTLTDVIDFCIGKGINKSYIFPITPLVSPRIILQTF